MAIKAVDRDEGRNGYVEYSLEDTTLPFTVGPVDGLLRVSGSLDRELRSNYTLEVTAKDRGEPPRSSSTTVTVTVLDENDNSPVFDPRQYSATVAENASIGASVLQVGALIVLLAFNLSKSRLPTNILSGTKSIFQREYISMIALNFVW